MFRRCAPEMGSQPRRLKSPLRARRGMLEPLLTDGPADKPLDQSGCSLTLAPDEDAEPADAERRASSRRFFAIIVLFLAFRNRGTRVRGEKLNVARPLGRDG